MRAVVMQVRFHDYYFQTCYPFLAALWAYLAVSIYEGSRALARNCRTGLSARGWLGLDCFRSGRFLAASREFNNLFERYEELQ